MFGYLAVISNQFTWRNLNIIWFFSYKDWGEPSHHFYLLSPASTWSLQLIKVEKPKGDHWLIKKKKEKLNCTPTFKADCSFSVAHRKLLLITQSWLTAELMTISRSPFQPPLRAQPGLAAVTCYAHLINAKHICFFMGAQRYNRFHQIPWCHHELLLWWAQPIN